MSTTLPDGRTARRTQTRAKIIAAAARLMADRGLAATSIDDIAAEAGVAKGSVFYNFGSKDALCAAIIGAGIDQLVAALEDARTQSTGWAAVEASALTVLSSVDRAPDMAQIVATELFRRGRPWHDQVGPWRARLLAPLTAMLWEAHRERASAGFPTSTPDERQVETIAVAVLGALMFSALDRLAYAPERDLGEIHAALMTTLAGLRP